MARMVCRPACWAKALSLSKVMDLRSAGSIANTATINGLSGGLSGEPSCKGHAGFALMENKHWPCALSNDEVTLPVAALALGEPHHWSYGGERNI
jgi:hypothetical protein